MGGAGVGRQGDARRRSARRLDGDGAADLGGPARDGGVVPRRRPAGRVPRLGARRARASGSRRPCSARSRTTTARRARRSSARSPAVIPFEGEAEAIAIANDTPYGLSGSVWTARRREGAARRARDRDRRDLDQLEQLGPRLDPVRRLQAVGRRPRAGPARARALHRGQERLLRDGGDEHAGEARGQGLRDHGRRVAASAPSPRGSSPRRARRSSASTSTRGRRATSRSSPTSPTPTRCARCTSEAREKFGRIDVLFNNAGHQPRPTTATSSRPRSTPGSGSRT